MGQDKQMNRSNEPVLVTGCAGFIGFHLAGALLKMGRPVVGLDNINDYYDVNLKQDRLKILEGNRNFIFYKVSLEEADALYDLFRRHELKHVIHLAAQAGVRYSLENPRAYVSSNMVGFLNILEACRQYRAKHLVYASSSSVYGANETKPFSVHHNVDHPLSLYAASKKANELMAHTYSHLYGLPATGLRFFTVYGPWGRPDMAPFLFTRAIVEGRPIKIFNHGKMQRDFTYIDDIVEAVIRVAGKAPEPDPGWDGKSPDPGSSRAPYRLYNLGNSRPVDLMHFISVLEKAVGKEAKKEYLPMQPGDVPETYADVEDLVRDTGYRPKTTVEEGVQKLVEWYKEYYRVSS